MEKIGEGSFGKVFKVMKKQNEFYAIKKITFSKGFKIHEVFEEFQRYSVIYKLRDDCLVGHFDAWIENCLNNNIVLYIKMELCDKTLDEIIYEIRNDSFFTSCKILTSIGYHTASQIFIEILESVQYLHKHNIIHRDLKSDNIMLKNDSGLKSFVKICDFRLIAIHKFAGQSHTIDRGNVKYAAPEVLDSKKYDTKADIYSLGKVLEKLFNIDVQE